MLRPYETELLEILLGLRDTLQSFWLHKAPPKVYIDTMANIGNLIQSLTNRQYGCATGRHSGACQCQESPEGPIYGKSLPYAVKRKRPGLGVRYD